MFNTLASLPFCPTVEHARLLLGNSFDARFAEIVESGQARTRTEYGHVIAELCADSERESGVDLERLCSAAERVLASSTWRGHHPTAIWRSRVSLGACRHRRVQAALRIERCTSGQAALVSIEIASEVMAWGNRSGGRSNRTRQPGLLLVALAHRSAKLVRVALAELLDNRDVSRRRLARAVVEILSVGRSASDRWLSADFWAKLSITGSDSSASDILCILAELFARARLMRRDELLDRWRTVSALEAVS